jgi:hypothetical protein
MVVGMLVHFAETAKRFAPILRDLDSDIHEIEPVKLVRRGVQLLIVVRSCGAGDGVRPFFPRGAPIGGAVDGAFPPVKLNGRIEDIRILR